MISRKTTDSAEFTDYPLPNIVWNHQSEENMKTQESRARILKKIEQENWDLVVVGGGITGAGILREAVRRNLKTLLVEQRDFAWGTSSRSSKMVHGGLRYLKDGDLALTYKSVRERQNLIRELPGLVEEKNFILPFYKGKLLEQLMLRFALFIYDLLAFQLKKHVYSLKKMNMLAPHVGKENLAGGFVIHDAVTDDARLVFRVLAEASRDGGTIVNYCRVNHLLKENNCVTGVILQDKKTSSTIDVKARLVVNATGVWADELRKEVRKTNKQKIRPLRGSHLILSADKVPLVEDISMFHPQDGRPLSILSWEGRVLVGTTDLDHLEKLDLEVAISREEVSYLLAAVNHIFPGLDVRKDDVIASIAGIRPVIDSGKENPSDESRDHAIWKEDGLLTVTGGKLTTFRLIALDILTAAQEYIGSFPDLEKKQDIFAVGAQILPVPQELSHEQFQRLQGRYGNRVQELLALSCEDELETVPGTTTLWAELRWAAANEFVVHLEDLMLRRTRLGLLLPKGGEEIMGRVRMICQPVLYWSDDQWETEEQNYLQLWKDYYGVPG